MNRATRTALAAAAIGAMLAFAGGALAANTGTIAVWHTPMVLGGSSSTTIHISVPQTTDPIAAANINTTTPTMLGIAVAARDRRSFSIAFSYLPRLTGEVPPKGAEGEGPNGDFRNTMIMIYTFQAPRLRLSPSGPAGHLPRMTGEARVGGAS